MIENEEVQQPETVIQGPGQILKLARKKANLSSQDIADKMKLKKSLVEDIEQDNYDINISLTFIRGYLKLYAKHVKVDETEILNAFENLSTQKKEPAKLQSFSRRVANQANDDKLMLVTYLIVAVVIALVVIWWFQQSTNDTATTSTVSSYPETASQEVTEKDILPLEELTNPEADLVKSESVEDSFGVAANAQAPISNDKPAVNNQTTVADGVADSANIDELAAVAEIPATDTVAPVELIFEFSGDCWMNLADATGENIAYGVKVKGRVMPVTGIPPFVVTLGAPEVVKIRYAGEPLDMSFLPSGRIAKFDLPLTE
ncbi:RodZ domain-containing protein [uncultured Paraglaciecola sp.]|uniref:RodZ domain-containing protein n=1 Tax=uncultured Paraglaciecola sp. TaxID=1765024 RepID=UPI0030D9752D|tara:strand:+ start:13146 stop:14096 length:951 start_codon:yes stop_codon:yes gene_type:complete